MVSGTLDAYANLEATHIDIQGALDIDGIITARALTVNAHPDQYPLLVTSIRFFSSFLLFNTMIVTYHRTATHYFRWIVLL